MTKHALYACLLTAILGLFLTGCEEDYPPDHHSGYDSHVAAPEYGSGSGEYHGAAKDDHYSKPSHEDDSQYKKPGY